MTIEAMEELFEKQEDEFLKFDRITQKRSTRPDIHAFLLLDELITGTKDMVSSAEHDQIFLEPDVEKLAEVVTEEQLLELIRCGVMYDSEYSSLSMFV